MWPEELKSATDNEAVLKEKYAKLNQELALQEDRVNEVLQLADSLLQTDHPDKISVMRRKEVYKGSNNLLLWWISSLNQT